MAMKIECPLCKGTLWIDPATGRVVDARDSKKQKMGLEDFVKSKDGAATRLEEEFKESSREAEKRKSKLEEEFRNIDKYKKEGDDDRPENPFDWD